MQVKYFEFAYSLYLQKRRLLLFAQLEIKEIFILILFNSQPNKDS